MTELATVSVHCWCEACVWGRAPLSLQTLTCLGGTKETRRRVGCAELRSANPDVKGLDCFLGRRTHCSGLALLRGFHKMQGESGALADKMASGVSEALEAPSSGEEMSRQQQPSEAAAGSSECAPLEPTREGLEEAEASGELSDTGSAVALERELELLEAGSGGEAARGTAASEAAAGSFQAPRSEETPQEAEEEADGSLAAVSVSEKGEAEAALSSLSAGGDTPSGGGKATALSEAPPECASDSASLHGLSDLESNEGEEEEASAPVEIPPLPEA